MEERDEGAYTEKLDKRVTTVIAYFMYVHEPWKILQTAKCPVAKIRINSRYDVRNGAFDTVQNQPAEG